MLRGQCEKDLATSPWSPTFGPFVLRQKEVNVWRIFLSEVYKPGLLNLLAADEIAKARQFHFTKDRENFITARGLLRLILARYLNIAPDQLRFCYNAYGKPALASGFCGNDVRFNVSHSNDIALYAITIGREVGIDVEYIQPIASDTAAADQFFSSREINALRSLPMHLQETAFYTGWARKEAYIKAVGKGLTIDLDRFDVELRPGEPPALLSVHDDPHEAARWSLQELIPADGYVGALAAEGNDWQLKCWQWQDEGE